MVKRDEGVRMGAEKLLTHSGKKMLFNAVKEYVEAKIELALAEQSTLGITYPIIEEKVKEAEELLQDMIMQLRIQVE